MKMKFECIDINKNIVKYTMFIILCLILNLNYTFCLDNQSKINIDDLPTILSKDQVDKIKSKNHCSHFNNRKSKIKNKVNYVKTTLKSRRFGDDAFSNYKIHFDYTYTLPHEKLILSQIIIPPVKAFLEQTLKVRKIQGKLRFPKDIGKCNEIPVPNYLIEEGVSSDMIILITTVKGIKKFMSQNSDNINDTSKNYIEKNNIISNLSSSSSSTSFIDSYKSFLNTLKNRTLNNPINKQLKEQLFNINVERLLANITANITNNEKFYEYEDVKEEEKSNVVGWASYCLQDQFTLRPVFGVMQYVADISLSSSNIEETIWTSMHEFTHLLGFDYNLFIDYINDDFTKVPLNQTILVKSKLKGLQELLDYRKGNLSDIQSFLNFDSEAFLNQLYNIKIDNNIYEDANEQQVNTTKSSNTTSSINASENSDESNNSISSNNSFSDQKKKFFTVYKNKNNDILLNQNDVDGITIYQNSTNQTINIPFTSEDNVILNINNSTEVYVNESMSKIDIKSILDKQLKLRTMSEYTEIKFDNELDLMILSKAISNFDDNAKILIKSQNVVKKGKEHYDCLDLEGVELEHYGGPGSSYSHWSKRYLNEDYMVADTNGEYVISTITLALLEDSGWYKVNYNNAQVLLWGYKKGCGFLEDKCVNGKILVKESRETQKRIFPFRRRLKHGSLSSSNSPIREKNIREDEGESSPIINSNYDEFCDFSAQQKCSSSRNFRGICSLYQYSEDLPDQYQYFSNAKNIGGISDMGDFCPYPLIITNPYTNSLIGNCKSGSLFNEDKGEKICEDCRCYMSSLIPENTIDHKKTSKNEIYNKYMINTKKNAICYETRCRKESDNVVLSLIIDNQEYDCPSTGGLITIKGYLGYVDCPIPDDLCKAFTKEKEGSSYSGYKLTRDVKNKISYYLEDFMNYSQLEEFINPQDYISKIRLNKNQDKEEKKDNKQTYSSSSSTTNSNEV